MAILRLLYWCFVARSNFPGSVALAQLAQLASLAPSRRHPQFAFGSSGPAAIAITTSGCSSAARSTALGPAGAPERRLGCARRQLRRGAIAVHFEHSQEMSGAVDQADRVWRIFVQHGYARVVEALRSNDAFGQQGMSLDEGTAD
jgi:hypothetical protein